MADSDRGGRSADWLRPRVEQQGLQRYVNTIRERIKLILAVTVLTTLAAVGYLAVAPKIYEAKSELLVTPVPADDPALSGLPIIRHSSDPTRDVETAARLIANRQVAERVRREVGPGAPDPLLDHVTAEPVAQSNLVAITARAESARDAQRIANGFAEQSIQVQTDKLHAALDKSIANLEARVDALQPEDESQGNSGDLSLRSQLTRLQTLRGQDDPTMSIQSRAAEPDTPASPKKKLTLIAGVLAGLILGIGGAFALQVLDPRLRREEQLRALYGLPVLGRIPKEGKGGNTALAPERLSPSTLEAYRTLRATLAASRRGSKTETPAILVTSPSPSEGKTTSAINLASSLALAGNSVILIEADLRRPAIGAALGVTTKTGTGSVLLGMADLEDALVETNAYGRYLRLLLADSSGGASGFMADQLFLPAAGHLVEDAKALADYVIVDSPPLAEVIDALPLAQQVDEVLVVVRLGRTQLTKLQNLGELLARSDIEPVGFAVVGVPDTGDGYYYASSAAVPKRSKAGSGRAAKS
ncbi:MAG TPA: Wzz/FepE/Etk N-terminal domain-containing protein [Thermoleophilaceae bacterium]|jgi:non-specific protein-tyrosine kinase